MAYSRSVLHDKKIIGVVYKYTSPSGKSYIGQTTNEVNRRRTWFCIKRRYAGYAIEKARQKYGPENFIYEVLFKQEFSTFVEAMEVLDRMEIYYIGKYDTLANGYNNTMGGLFPKESIQTKYGSEEIEKAAAIARANTRRNKPHHTRAEINLLRKETNRRKGYWQKIYQFDLEGNFLREFASAGEAMEWLKNGNTMNIKRACKTLGKYYGYNWRFAEDGYIMKVKPKRVCTKERYVHQYKPVIRYDLNMNYIDEFESITAAARFLGISHTSGIGACLSGKKPTAHKYKWRYK